MRIWDKEERGKEGKKKKKKIKQTKTQPLLSSFHIIKGFAKQLQHRRQKE